MRNEVLSCFDAVIRSLSSLNLIRAELYFIFSLTWAPIEPLSTLQSLSIYTTGRSELFMIYLPSCKRCLNMVDWFETSQRDSIDICSQCRITEISYLQGASQKIHTRKTPSLICTRSWTCTGWLYKSGYPMLLWILCWHSLP